ncbi:MAG: hypothetical protein KDC98_15350, partial [Planctomycetes bacterium]|nr:hypothetical protein [Planctomycetota bacterium]
MNLALVYCWKEWRAQRAILLAYCGLIFSCLCLGLSLAPRHYWFEEGFGVHALAWFITAGVIGVVAFVAPGLIRAEYAGKDDQFVRRLPGALRPAFAGKLLFLLLATLLLPLLGLLVGEIFVQARGANWNELFVWSWDGAVELRWPSIVLMSGGALLLSPWVWAIGSWMPGGRMALGGAALFVLLLGVSVFAVLRQSPGLDRDLLWWHWLWLVPPAGLATAAISFCRGRRGGGALRSARFGLMTSAVMLLAPAVWLGDQAWRYHHPDLARLRTLHVSGLSPDGRFVLAAGAAKYDHRPVPLRIDLATGTAAQLGSVWTGVWPGLLGQRLRSRARQRLWLWYDAGTEKSHAFDLVDLTWTEVENDWAGAGTTLPPDLHRLARDETRDALGLRTPDGDVVWLEAGELCRRTAGGEIARQACPVDGLPTQAAGHGFVTYGRGGKRLFDLRGGSMPLSSGGCWIVRDQVLIERGRDRFLQTMGGTGSVCEALRGCAVHGLFDDDRVLCSRRSGEGDSTLLLYCPGDGSMAAIGNVTGGPKHQVSIATPLERQGSLLPRDPEGRIWIEVRRQQGWTFALLDTATLAISQEVEVPPNREGRFDLLDWDDV